jgi:magnesium chelatase family protein
MIHSAAGVGLPPNGLVTRPPLRAPHHTASLVAMVGGGTTAMRPGEASLAHRGVLLLDELAEFHPSVLDGLRQPLEEGLIRVIRARASVEFSSRFLLVGTMNPCPCGADEPYACTCAPGIRNRYLRRVSGPLLDRFDLRLHVHRPSVEELLGGPPAESTARVATRVVIARERMAKRGFGLNAQLPAHLLDELAPLTPAASRLLRRELELQRLSGRGLHRVRRVARTLADLDGEHERLGDEFVSTALSLRVDPYRRVEAAA